MRGGSFAYMTKLVVLDLETSGLDPKKHCILEVAYRILDLQTLQECMGFSFHFSAVVCPPEVDGPKSFDAWVARLDPFIRDMHAKNGLLAEIREELQQGDALDIDDVSRHLQPVLRIIKDAEDDGVLMLTGNSLASLDIPMLREYMPAVYELFHYRTMDISVIRSFYRLVVGSATDALMAKATNGDTHRAMDDVLSCAEALRALRAHARGGSVPRASLPTTPADGAQPAGDQRTSPDGML